jgi:hypothetical protein
MVCPTCLPRHCPNISLYSAVYGHHRRGGTEGRGG